MKGKSLHSGKGTVRVNGEWCVSVGIRDDNDNAGGSVAVSMRASNEWMEGL
jgi:hypothetical protein